MSLNKEMKFMAGVSPQQFIQFNNKNVRKSQKWLYVLCHDTNKQVEVISYVILSLKTLEMSC